MVFIYVELNGLWYRPYDFHESRKESEAQRGHNVYKYIDKQTSIVRAVGQGSNVFVHF